MKNSNRKTITTSALIAALAALPLLGIVTGCATSSPSEQAMIRQSDMDHGLASKVAQRLNTDSKSNYSDVGVLASNGAVQLTGFVKTVQIKNRAGELASSVPGVASVDNILCPTNTPSVQTAFNQ